MRAFMIVASVAAALGAGAVASSAQSPRDPAPAPALAVAGCEGALPAPAPPATVVKFDGIAGEFAVDQFRIGAAAPGGHRPLVLGQAAATRPRRSCWRGSWRERSSRSSRVELKTQDTR